MKRIVLVIAALGVVASVGASAQNMSIGPSLLWKGGLNAGNIPEGTKTAVNINLIPDVAATFRILLNRDRTLGFTLDAGYAQYTYRMRPENEQLVTDQNTIIYKHTFFNLAPMFYFAGFQVGASFGFPLAYNMRRADGSSQADLTTTQTSPNVELRLAGMIPVFRDKTGQVNVLIHGGYMLTGVIDKSNFSAGNDTYNPKVVSFGFGVNYLFTIQED